MDKYLFIGAHPDDIELGAGATLAKASDSKIECHALVLSDCHESLNDPLSDDNRIVLESTRALAVLGIEEKNTTFYSFSVRSFPRLRQEILQTLIDKARSENYTRVYVPASFDIHQDHSVVAIESMRAFKFCSILGYELPWNNFQGEIRYFNVLESNHVQMKKIALREFRSQAERFYFDDQKIETILKFRGLQVNSDFAEAFQILRWIDY